jgi:pimeloyl-ACP methyl ester carboxylesterase
VPFEFAQLLFHDPVAGAALLTGGLDFGNVDAIAEFYIGNARRMGMAGKILFPIPNRQVAKRLYRLSAPTLILWGRSDALIPPVYAEKWRQLIAGARLQLIDAAGHMVPYEQPAAFCAAVKEFLG